MKGHHVLVELGLVDVGEEVVDLLGQFILGKLLFHSSVLICLIAGSYKMGIVDNDYESDTHPSFHPLQLDLQPVFLGNN